MALARASLKRKEVAMPMQTTIRISPEVHDVLIDLADEFRGTLRPGELQSDGWYEVPVEAEVLERLDRIDEDPDQAARRLLGWAPLPS
jgi:hypothetical protein